MASERALKALGDDAAAVRAIAVQLLKLGKAKADGPATVDWTDWELDFLEARSRQVEPLSERQREKFDELRRAAERHATVDGFSLRAIIDGAFAERLDLDDEDDVEFIEKLRAALLHAAAHGIAFTVSGRQKTRLVRICRNLGVIEVHQGAGWSPADAALPSAR